MDIRFLFFVCAIIIIVFAIVQYYHLYVNPIYTEHEYEIINKPRPNINYMDGIDAIYWINLDRSNDRRMQMNRFLKDPVFKNMKIERVSAVDGKRPDTVYPRLQFMYKQKNDYEYACMLSHLDTINMFSKTNYNVALIMEDDLTMELRPYWRKSIKEVIDGAPKDWEIIQLCYNTQANIKNFSLYERNVRNKTVCAAAYLISNRAAKRLIGEIYSDNKYNLEHYIIHHADCYIFNKLITYTYKYPYFIYKTNNNSLLHPEDLNSHERSKRQVLEMFKGLSNKNIS
jgi:GR25 family glycosyltransferase involved in LPS biosynthesis